MAEEHTRTAKAECIFCRIASGEARAEIVHQDDVAVAFRDLNPQAPIHLLVIPRQHIGSLRDLSDNDDKLAGHLVRICVQAAELAGIAERGFRIVANSGREAGQSVDHLHFHVLGGRPMRWPPG